MKNNLDIENKCDLANIPKYYLDVNISKKWRCICGPLMIYHVILFNQYNCHITNMILGNFTYFLGEMHIYMKII